MSDAQPETTNWPPELGAVVRCGDCGAILSWTLAEFVETKDQQRQLNRAVRDGHHIEQGVPYRDGIVTGCRCPKDKVA